MVYIFTAQGNGGILQLYRIAAGFSHTNTAKNAGNLISNGAVFNINVVIAGNTTSQVYIFI